MTPAIDRRRPTRLAFRTAALSIAAATAIAGLIGCDEAGHARAMAVQAEAASAAAVGGVLTKDTLDKLAEIAGGDRATPVVIESRRSLGQAKLDVAHAKAIEVAELQRRATRQIYRIAGVTNQAQSSATIAAVYLKLDPKASVTQLQSFAAAAKGGADAQTFDTVPDAKIPSLAAVDQQKSKLEGDVARQESELAELTKQRDAKLTAAGEASGRADREKGEARLTIVKEVAESRKEAAELSRKIGAVESQLAQSKADLAVQDALKTQLTEAVAGFEQQAEVVKTGWTKVSQEANKLNAQAKAALGGNGDTAVKALAADFAEQEKALAAARDEAEKAYKEAIEAFASAATLANTLVGEISNAKSAAGGQPFEQAAWDTQAALFAADRINLDKAEAELGLASFRAQAAGFLATQHRAAATLEKAGKPLSVPSPASFDPATVKGQVDAAVKAADADYAAAQSTLEGITLSGTDLAVLKPRRDTMRVLAHYSRAQLANLAEQAGVAAEIAGTYKATLQSAKDAAKEARDGGTVLPRLPAEITPAPAAAAPTEGTPPAEGTAPAEGATPAATPPAATPPAGGAAATPETPAAPAPAAE